MSEEIAVGQKVVNRLSGIKGYVAMRTESLTGYIWLGVQPPVSDKDKTAEPKSVWGDECEWKAMVGTVPRPAEPRVGHPRFELGDRLKDKVSGFEGIATSRTEHLNRCFSYSLESEKLKKDDGTVVAQEFQAPRLSKLNSGLNEHKDRKVEPRPTGASPNSVVRVGF